MKAKVAAQKLLDIKLERGVGFATTKRSFDRENNANNVLEFGKVGQDQNILGLFCSEPHFQIA